MAEMIFACSLLFYFIKHSSHHPSTSLRTWPSHWKDKPHKMHEMHEMHVLYHSAQMQRPARQTLPRAPPVRTGSDSDWVLRCRGPRVSKGVIRGVSPREELRPFFFQNRERERLPAARRSMRKGYAFPTRSPREPGGYAAIQIQFSKTKVNFIDHNQPTHLPDSLEGHFSRIDTLFTKRTKRSFLSVLARGRSLSYTRSEAECVGRTNTVASTKPCCYCFRF